MKEQIIIAKDLTIKNEHNHNMLQHCDFTVGRGDFVIFSYRSRYVKEMIQFFLNQNMSYSGSFLYHGELLSKKHRMQSYWVSENEPLIETVSIAENIIIYQSRQKFFRLYRSGEAGQVMKLYTQEHPLPFDLEESIVSLKKTHKYIVFMIKAVLMGSDIVLLDDVPDDCDEKELFWIHNYIKQCSEDGITFIQFARKEEPLVKFADYIYFIHAHTISYLMFRDEYSEEVYRKVLIGSCIQKVSSRLSVADYQKKVACLNLKNLLEPEVELDIYKGEVFSVLDLTGCFSDRIYQYIKSDACELEIRGKKISSYGKAVKNGMALVSFKGGSPMFPQFSVVQNLSFQIIKQISDNTVINTKMEKYIANQYMNKINGACNEYSYRWRILVYRWLISNPALMILEEPLLIDAEDDIYSDFQNTVSDIVQTGCSCLVISNLPKSCLKISDRVLIVHDKEHFREFDMHKEAGQKAYDYVENRG